MMRILAGLLFVGGSSALAAAPPPPPELGCLTSETLVSLAPRGSSAKYGRLLFGEPPPPEGGRAGEVPALEAALAKDAAYQKVFAGPRPELNLFLSYVSELMASNTVGDQGSRRQLLLAGLRAKKLEDSAVTVYKVFARTGRYPDEFGKRLCRHLEATRSEPHLGTFTVYKDGGPIHDYSGLAAWFYPLDAAYLRTFIDAKPHEYVLKSGPSTSVAIRKEPYGPFQWPSWTGPFEGGNERPWMLGQDAAIGRLGMLTKLTPDEEKFSKDMDELSNTP
jgi:hypothetical protein